MRSQDGFEVVNRLVRAEPVNRRTVLRALGLSALAGGLPLAAPGLARAQRPKPGGTMRIALDENIDTLDPHNATFITACAVHNNIYNGLLKITYDGKTVDFKPQLAREWEVQGDRVHVFRLHKGVTFHNGEPCTAAEVKASLERVKDKAQSPIHAWKLELLEAIETPDSHTVKLSFAKPYPFLRVALTGSTGRAGTIVSPKAAQESGKAFGRKPVGTGPFRFVEWKEGDYILLEKNPNYWETDAGGTRLPYLDKLQFKFIVEPSTLVAALQTGEVDGVNQIVPQFMPTVRANPSLAAYTVVSAGPPDAREARHSQGHVLDRWYDSRSRAEKRIHPWLPAPRPLGRAGVPADGPSPLHLLCGPCGEGVRRAGSPRATASCLDVEGGVDDPRAVFGEAVVGHRPGAREEVVSAVPVRAEHRVVADVGLEQGDQALGTPVGAACRRGARRRGR